MEERKIVPFENISSFRREEHDQDVQVQGTTIIEYISTFPKLYLPLLSISAFTLEKVQIICRR